MQRSRAQRAIAVASSTVVAISPPALLGRFWLNTAVFVLVFAIGALGLNVLTGYTGQLSVGHAFFLAVGAYSGGVLGVDHGLSAALWIPGAGVIAAACGLAVAPAALRLRGLYLAIATIALVFVGQHIWLNATAISGGTSGRSFPSVVIAGVDPGRPRAVLGVTLSSDALSYYLALAILSLSMLFVWNLTRTRLGRAMQAVRERELVAELMGVNVARTKLAAFGISSFLAGIAGALYGSLIHYASPGPETWDLLLSIQFLAIIIVGGLGTVWGALTGSIFITALPLVLDEYADTIPGGLVQHGAAGGGIAAGDLAAICYGILIIAFLVVEPGGMAGVGSRIRRAVRRLEASER